MKGSGMEKREFAFSIPVLLFYSNRFGQVPGLIYI